jgi:signal transduction histidine kinase
MRFFPKLKLPWLLEASFGLAALVVLIVLGQASRGSHAPLPYLYEDTRQLVLMVQDAARLFQEEGTNAFPKFALSGSRWFNKRHYLFIYDLDMVCVFHAVSPELLGKNLLDMKDIIGEPIGRWINEIGHDPGPDASGWIFYLWQAPNDLAPSWKGSYVQKAVGRDGKVYLVGSGLYRFKMEPLFVERMVDDAANLLRDQGEKAAFAQFLDPASRFSISNTVIYVMDDQGGCLVDPSFPNLAGRNLADFKDAIGHYPVREAIEQLKKKDRVWKQYMLPRPGSASMSRKLAYVRRVQVNGRELIVWADFFLATPIWMR